VADWSSVFDEAHPEAGATAADIAHLVATVGQPISPSEIEEVKRDLPLGSCPPFDPSRWVISDRPLPVAYLSFLRWSNGGEFRTGERHFQFFPALDPAHGVRAMLLAYHLPQYMPGALPFAFNGSGTFYLFDMRKPAVAGEYPVVCSQAGNQGWQVDQFMEVSDTFSGACRGTVDVDDLWWQR